MPVGDWDIINVSFENMNTGNWEYWRQVCIYIHVYVITPLGVLLLVYKPEARGRVAPDGEGL